jgi:hypothetical protein
MAEFFEHFPKIQYDVSKTGNSYKDVICDVFFRFKFIEAVKRQNVIYFPYVVTTGDTPEIVSDKVYDDIEGHWIIMMLNDIIDPHFDWYMEEDVFLRFLKDKYGSVATAYNTPHHYEKRISTIILDNKSNDVYVNTVSQIDYTDIQNTDFSTIYTDIPFDNYVDMAETTYNLIPVNRLKNIEMITTKQSVSCYEYENDLNNKRKIIRLIRPEMYSAVKQEFKKMAGEYNPTRRQNLRDVRL